MSLSDFVLIGGRFDPLHAGHLAYLREASNYGPVLCALSDDPQKHPFVVPICERATLLKWLGVDRVVIGPSVAEVLATEKPRAYIKGSDWRGKLPQEEIDICVKLGIQIVYTETVTQSSSKLLADYETRRNAATLKSFEDWMQQPRVQQPWRPVTDYSRETRLRIETPHADILAEIFTGCSVLDYGCGFGYLVDLLRESGMDAAGWDPYTEQHCYTREPHDLVICREVLEHIPVDFLTATVRDLISLSRRYVYVTTRFTAKSHLLEFDTSDDLDPTHITMLNQDFLRALFVLEGCTRRPDLEDRLDWMQKGRVLVYEVPQ